MERNTNPVEELSQAEKANLVNKEYVLAKLVDVTEGIGVWERAKPQQILQGIKMLGEFLKMFVQHKKVDIDIRQMISTMPTDVLKGIVNVEATEVRSSKNRSPHRLTDGDRGHAGL